MESSFNPDTQYLSFTPKAMESGVIRVYKKTTYPIEEIDPLTCPYEDMIRLYNDGHVGLFDVTDIVVG